MLIYKIWFMLCGKKYMGFKNSIFCVYDMKTKKYQMYYVDGFWLTYVKEYINRYSAIFYLNILNNNGEEA